jgi:DNA-binding transcriptional MocR family regulator
MSQSLGLKLDAARGEPLYQQIFDQVVGRIRTGTFPVGFRLPPSRNLASALGTNRNTVVRAYEELLSAGFVESTVGRGTFVAAVPPPAPRLSVTAPAGPDTVPEAQPLPWASLLARSVFAEPLSRVERLQRSMAPMSTDAINLARLEPGADLIPDELIRRCAEHVLRTAGGKVLRYSARDGLPRLRGLIAEDLARQGVPAAAEDIVVTSGSQQGIDLLARALINPGEPFLVDGSTFAGALSAFTAAGARLCGVPSDEEGPSPAALERLGPLGAKGIYLMPNSHNPTGASISPRRREALVAWSRRFSVPIIEDDYVADLNLDGAAPPTPMRALDGDVIYVGTFSKRLAPALRVGFVVVPAALRPKVLLLRHAMDTGSSEFLQHVLSEFLERGYLQAHLAKSLPIYRRRRDALEAALARHLPPGFSWRRPERGLSLWLALPAPFSPQEVFEQAHRKGVLVHPSSLNAVEDRGQGGIRLTFCAEPEARLIEGARRLGRALASAGGRGRQDDSVASMGGI